MLDWINTLISGATVTLQGVVTFVAAVAFLISCQRGGWTLARIVTSAVVAGLVVAVVWNMSMLAHKFEPELRSAPAIGITAPPPAHYLVHI